MNISEYHTYWYNYYKELNINFFEYSDYNKLKTTNDTHLIVVDHLNGFDINGHNQILEQLNSIKRTVEIQYVLTDKIKSLYNNLEIKFINVGLNLALNQLLPTKEPAEKNFKNFQEKKFK